MNNNQPTPPMEGGPQITGKWFNPHSGDVINVRDSLIDGDEMYLITDKGRMSMQQFQQYLQVDENEVIPNESALAQSFTDIKSQLAATATNDGALSPDLDIFVDKTIQELPKTNNEQPIFQQPVQSSATVNTHKENKSFEMIDKIFTKSNIVPKIKLIIEDDNFPYNELAMLMEYFEVSPDDIAEYVKDKFITGDIIKDCIGSYDK